MKKILFLVCILANAAYADQAAINALMGLGMSGALATQIDAQYSTAITASFLPSTDNTFDLGSASKHWKTGYFGTSILTPGWTMGTTLAQTAAGDKIIFNSTNFLKAGLSQGTADGADNGVIGIYGGGAPGASRGAQVQVFGNENAETGRLYIDSGNTATSFIALGISSAAGLVQINNTSAAKMWSFNNSGQLVQDATNGGDIILNKAGTKLTLTKGGGAATAGTFVCNGVTGVTVATTSASANMIIDVTLNTVGGTVGNRPSVKTISSGTSFTIAGDAADTSTYNWAMRTLQ